MANAEFDVFCNAKLSAKVAVDPARRPAEGGAAAAAEEATTISVAELATFKAERKELAALKAEMAALKKAKGGGL